MTMTETRPEVPEGATQAPPTPPLPPRSSAGGWWLGGAAGLGIVALAVAVVALVVALGNTGTSRTVATGGKPAATTPAQPAAPQAFAASDIPVTLTEFKAALPATTVTAGTKSLQITNAGTVQHEVLIFRPDASIDPASLPLGPDGNVKEEAAGINKVSDGDNIDPGKSQSRQIDLSQPGTYVFVCNLPGHYKLGMWAQVTVR